MLKQFYLSGVLWLLVQTQNYCYSSSGCFPSFTWLSMACLRQFQHGHDNPRAHSYSFRSPSSMPQLLSPQFDSDLPKWYSPTGQTSFLNHSVSCIPVTETWSSHSFTIRSILQSTTCTLRPLFETSVSHVHFLQIPLPITLSMGVPCCYL